MTDNEKQFLENNKTAVLATVDREGAPGASVIYYLLEGQSIYYVTKTSTAKYSNILTNPNVALCIYDEQSRATAEITGSVFEVKDEAEQVKILNQIAKVRRDGEESWVPPVVQVSEGKLAVMRVEVSSVKFSDYKNHERHEA